MNHIIKLFADKCICTVTGKYLDVFDPKPEMICIDDIAKGLSHTCRFAGQLKQFYSVAQHSWYCYQLAEGTKQRKAALLHDASEAYLGDLPRPIKHDITLSEYRKIEDRLMEVIAGVFHFQYPIEQPVKDIDKKMLVTEHRILRLGERDVIPEVIPYEPKKAEQLFLDAYNKIVMAEIEEIDLNLKKRTE